MKRACPISGVSLPAMAEPVRAPQFVPDRLLPEPLPPEPLRVLREWLAEAEAKNICEYPNAATLATADARGRPSARIVLAKGIDADAGRIVFFTNRRSRKGRDLEANPWASLVFWWEALSLQARVEGPVTLVAESESDEYFASRWILSRVGAWASEQSAPVASREALLEKVAAAAHRLGVPLDGETEVQVPRPPHWGGYAVWAERVELWIGQPGRIHDRGLWERALTPERPREAGGVEVFRAGPWRAMRLQP